MPIPFRRLAAALALLLATTSAAGCDRMPTGATPESGGVRALQLQEVLPTPATSSADDGTGWLGGGGRTSSEDSNDTSPGASGTGGGEGGAVLPDSAGVAGVGTGWLGGGG
jgi:hypothetical protein